MSSNFFLNETLIWPILIRAILLWALFVYKEWPGSYSMRFWTKISIGLVSITALAFIFLKPLIPADNKLKSAVLLTEGYNQEVLDSIKRKNKNIFIINYTRGESILKDNNEINSLMILGQGIQTYDHWQLEHVPTQYLGRNSSRGITSLFYRQNNRMGDKLSIQGNFQKASLGSKLILEAPGGIDVDSVILSSGEDQKFQLSTELKVEGKYLYNLTEKDSSGEILNSNPVPVKISKRIPLKILIIETFPTFETKYLKNYLAEAGQEVSIRTQITTGRYKFEYFNTDKKETISFSENTFNTIDLLIIDEATLKGLSKSELLALKKSIRDGGLGVFIQPTLEFFNTKNQLASLQFKRDNRVLASLDPNSNIEVTKYPYQFVPENRLQIIASTDDLVLAAYQKNGLGRVGTSVLENSYQLVLDGNGDQFQDLWSKIIERISKKASVSSEFMSDQFVVLKDEPFNFKLRTVEAMPEVVDFKGTEIPLKQDLTNSGLWTGTVYPKEKGWQTLRLQQDTSITLDYYVNDLEVWRSLIAVKTKLGNMQNFRESVNEIGIQNTKEPIDPIWFYVIFLIGMGYLWLEPKLYEA